MRRMAILLALVPACALLSACGKGSYTVTSTSATTASTTPSGATGRHGKGAHRGGSPSPSQAQALAFAHAVNLTAADVPGFNPSRTPEHESATERRLQAQLRSCGGGAGASAPQHSPGALAQASSPHFELKRGILALSASSEVNVAHSPAEAKGVLQAIGSARVRACFSQYLLALLRSEQHVSAERVLGVSIASGTPPAPGTSGGFGWRVSAKLSIRGVPVSLYFDILGFVIGPAQVTLTSSGTIEPFPARAQEQLYTELLTRARAQKP